MTDTGVIAGVSVSHSLASVDEIESAQSVDVATLVSGLSAREGVEEAFAVQTCNRAEAYVAADDASAARGALEPFAPEVREGAVVRLDHESSLRHLMRVAAGLESLVLGEDQILGQLKDAATVARESGGLRGGVLDDALHKAFHVGERARAETRINEGSVSLGSAAVELARRETDVAGATALVVGAGEMGTLAARALAASPVSRVVVANRTLADAEHVAAELDAAATAIGLDEVPARAADADVLIAATGADEPILGDAAFAAAGETLCIDLGQPRDVVPDAGGDDVAVRDIDDLESVTGETHERREAAKLEAQGELTDRQRETVAGLADALVGQLLAAPTKSLREAAAEDDWTTIHTAMQLFDPEFDDSPPIPDVAGPPDGAESPSEVPSHVLDRLTDD
ncbi:glutamyl-tRNA reductase [Halobacteriales archaeon QS_6_71_20]|nr:MAG: glutamyl-tRNA reductase [Halobacteriales archaeon QS_6_71_20]